MKEQYHTSSVEDTISRGKELGRSLLPGDVVCLHGGLGSGKTHFAKGIAEAFGITRDTVNSPTFVLIQEYAGTLPVYHFDAYRLGSQAEALAIGVPDYFNGDGVCVVEWPDRLGTLIPPDAVHVHINKTGEHSREIIIEKSE